MTLSNKTEYSTTVKNDFTLYNVSEMADGEPWICHFDVVFTKAIKLYRKYIKSINYDSHTIFLN